MSHDAARTLILEHAIAAKHRAIALLEMGSRDHGAIRAMLDVYFKHVNSADALASLDNNAEASEAARAAGHPAEEKHNAR